MKHFFSLMRGWPVVLLILLTLVGPAAWAQAPSWQMAIAATNQPNSSSRITATVADATGNVYVAGAFKGTVGFSGTLLTSITANYEDVFVAKWSSASNRFVWAQQAGGTEGESATALALSGANVYVAGNLSSTAASFGPTVVTTAGRTDIFVAKLVDAGASAGFSWAQLAGGVSDDYATAVAVNGSNVYVAGSFSGTTASFGSSGLVTTGGLSNSDVFVAKLSDAGSTGSFVWAQGAGGTANDVAQALAVSGANVYVAGNFTSAAARFGSIIVSNANIGGYGTPDLFVTKVVDAGSSAAFAWAQQGGGTGFDSAQSLAVSGTSIYIAGAYNSTTIAFGSTSLASYTPGTQFSDVFVARLDDASSNASFVWAQRAGGPGSDVAQAIMVRGPYVYIAGYYNGAISDFGSTTLTNANGYNSLFVAKLLDNGTGAGFAWAQQAGSTAGTGELSLAISNSSIYLASGATPPVTFGSIVLASPISSLAAVLASLTDPTLTATTAPKGALSFSLAPNPARAATTVLLPALPGAATATLTLRDALGRALHTETISLPAAGLRHELDLTGLPASLYAVQVQAGAATATRRLVVE